MAHSRPVGQLGPFKPSLDAQVRPGARASMTTSLWKRNRVGEEVSAVKDGDEAVQRGAVVELDLSGAAGNSVERLARMSINYCLFEVHRAQKVGRGWSDVHKCEVRVHLGEREGVRG